MTSVFLIVLLSHLIVYSPLVSYLCLYIIFLVDNLILIASKTEICIIDTTGLRNNPPQISFLLALASLLLLEIRFFCKGCVGVLTSSIGIDCHVEDRYRMKI